MNKFRWFVSLHEGRMSPAWQIWQLKSGGLLLLSLATNASNVADYLKVRLHNKLSTKQRKGPIVAFNYTFAGHTFVTRNSNQTTRHSPPGGVDGWAQDYCKRSYKTPSSCGMESGHTKLIPTKVWSQQLIPYIFLWYTSAVSFQPLWAPPSGQEHLPPLSMKGHVNVVTIDLTFAAFFAHFLYRPIQSCSAHVLVHRDWFPTGTSWQLFSVQRKGFWLSVHL